MQTGHRMWIQPVIFWCHCKFLKNKLERVKTSQASTGSNPNWRIIFQKFLRKVGTVSLEKPLVQQRWPIVWTPPFRSQRTWKSIFTHVWVLKVRSIHAIAVVLQIVAIAAGHLATGFLTTSFFIWLAVFDVIRYRTCQIRLLVHPKTANTRFKFQVAWLRYIGQRARHE